MSDAATTTELSKNLRTHLALDAVEMGIWTRQHPERDVAGLVHHSDRDVHYVAVPPSTWRRRRFAAVGTTGTALRQRVGSDNALVQLAVPAELIRNKWPWKNISDLEIALADYVDWFNHQRLHGQSGLPPRTTTSTSAVTTASAPVGASVQDLH